MARKTTKTTTPPLVNDGKPSGKGKGGTVTVHGVTTTGYQRGCRCDLCKAAAADYARAARERKAEAAKTEATAKEQKAAKAKARRDARKVAAA
jgi:hypothetical protein